MSNVNNPQTRLFETITNWYFLTKVSYFTSQEVGNNVQIIIYVKLSSFQPILNLSHFWWTIIHFKAAYWWFLQIQMWQNEGAIHISNYWLCLNIDYVVWFVMKNMNKILQMVDVSFAYLLLVVNSFLINSTICSWHLFRNECYNMGSNNRAKQT